MHLNQFFLSALTLSTAAQATIKFYGSDGQTGDYVSCTVPDSTDEESSALFSLRYPALFIPGTNDFQLNGPLQCGSEASDSVAASVAIDCNDIGGDSICIPAGGENSMDPSAVKRTQSSGEHSRSHSHSHSYSHPHSDSRIAKRKDAAQCDEYTGGCRSQYPVKDTSPSCPSGSTREEIKVQGSPPSFWCSAPCPADEQQTCKGKSCDSSRDACEAPGSAVSECTEALLKCRGTSNPGVRMSEDRCSAGNFDGRGGVEQFFQSAGFEGVVYEDGVCRVDAQAFAAYQKAMEQLVSSGGFAGFSGGF